MDRSCDNCLHNPVCKIWCHLQITIQTETFSLFKEDIKREIAKTIGGKCYHFIKYEYNKSKNET